MDKDRGISNKASQYSERIYFIRMYYVLVCTIVQASVFIPGKVLNHSLCSRGCNILVGRVLWARCKETVPSNWDNQMYGGMELVIFKTIYRVG